MTKKIIKENWKRLINRIPGNGWAAWLGLTGVVAVGMLLLLYGMRLGPGVGGDATIYIFSARNLIEGRGLGLIGPEGEFRLIPYFPPFFSLVLAVFGLMGLDMTSAGMVLNTLLFGGIIYLTGAVTWRFSQEFLPTLMTASLIAVSPVLIPVYSWVMSEPLSIFLGFAGSAVILRYIEKPEVGGFLFTAALLAGLSFLTRYSSVAFLGAGVLAIIVISKNRLMIKIRDCLLYGVIGCLPMIIWLVVDYSLTSTVASRRLESAQGLMERVVRFWQNFQELFLFWIIPESWIYASPPYPAWLNTFLFYGFWLGVIVLTLAAFRRYGDEEKTGLPGLAFFLGIFVLVYLGVVAFISFTTYPPITIANRMFSPFHIAVLWLLMVLLALGRKKRPGDQNLYLVLIIGMLVLNGVYLWRSYRITAQYRLSGLGYNSTAWRESPTIGAARMLPMDRVLITNETMALLYLTGRASDPLMEIYWPEPGNNFTSYGEGDLTNDHSQRLFRQEDSPLILFDTIFDQFSQLYGNRANERVKSLTEKLFESFRGHDGVIYYFSTPGEKR